MEQHDAPATRRLFFALWPDADTVQALGDWVRLAREACGGRPMRADTLHLTLAFLGAVGTDRIPALSGLLAPGRWPGGTLALDRFGRFRGPRIVWAGSSAPVPWLDALQAALWQEIQGLGFAPPSEPFRPHVSLLRQAVGGDLSDLPAMRPVIWTPRRLALVASTPGPRPGYYQMIADCSLRAP